MRKIKVSLYQIVFVFHIKLKLLLYIIYRDFVKPKLNVSYANMEINGIQIFLLCNC